MEDIRKQDLRLFFHEAFSFGRLLIYFGVIAFIVYQLTNGEQIGPAFVTIPTASVMIAVITAYNASVKKRFKNQRMESRWNECQDRLNRFEQVIGKMRKEGVADLQEMPNTIRGVAKSLYLALRRADIIADEISATESGMLSKPPVWNAQTQDAQSRELYRLADKNIAEYRSQFAGVLAGVQRTEAQSAVFMTALDSLRMKLIGYRLVGRNPSMHSEEFLEAIAEARMQLQSIDTALEELDLGHYPKTIAVVPPVEQVVTNQS